MAEKPGGLCWPFLYFCWCVCPCLRMAALPCLPFLKHFTVPVRWSLAVVTLYCLSLSMLWLTPDGWLKTTLWRATGPHRLFQDPCSACPPISVLICLEIVAGSLAPD